SDLVGADRPGIVRELKDRLRILNPGARMIDAVAGQVPASDMVAMGPCALDGKIADVKDWLRTDAVERSERHDHGAGHAGHAHHDANRHDERIRTFCLT